MKEGEIKAKRFSSRAAKYPVMCSWFLDTLP